MIIYILILILFLILIYKKNVVISITHKDKNKTKTKKYSELIMILCLFILLYMLSNKHLVYKIIRFLNLLIINLKKLKKINIDNRFNKILDKKINSTINNIIKESE